MTPTLSGSVSAATKTGERGAHTVDWFAYDSQSLTVRHSDGNDRFRTSVGRVVRYETRVFKVVVHIPPVTDFRERGRGRQDALPVGQADFTIETVPVSRSSRSACPLASTARRRYRSFVKRITKPEEKGDRERERQRGRREANRREGEIERERDSGDPPRRRKL